MDYLLTFLEGVVTFLSPCLLPLLPVYVAFFAGGVRGDDQPDWKRTILCVLCFVFGFALLFTLMGAFAGAVGSLVVQHRRTLEFLCGVMLVVLGLNYLGVLNIGLLNSVRRPHASAHTSGPVGSVLLGVVFAVGWTPCVGTFLASALSLAASSASVTSGVGLLMCYSVGLGLPFVISAVLINQLENAFSWVKQHYVAINRVCGGLLVAEGFLMASGLLGALMGSFS